MKILFLILPFFLKSVYAVNLLENPSFEVDKDSNGVADGWFSEIHTHQGAQGYLTLDTKIFYDGKTSQRIINTSITPAWVRISQMPIKPCAPITNYCFSCFVKADCPYRILVYEFRKTTDYFTHHIASGKKTKDWEQIANVFQTHMDADYFKVSLITEGKGEAYFDKTSLSKIGGLRCIKAYPTTHPPNIDGKTDEQIWAETDVASIFFLLGKKGELASAQTKAFACYDTKNIYIAFVCEEPQPQKMVLRSPTYDSPVWLDDCVEVFLDVTNTGKEYYHFAVNAKGVRADEKKVTSVPKRRNTEWYKTTINNKGPRLEDWDGEWEAAASIGDKKWSVEIMIPFSELGIKQPKAGDLWKINFCRERKVEDENSCWSYIDGESFHSIKEFGYLVFIGRKIVPPKVVSQKQIFKKPLIIPQPQSLVRKKGKFIIDNKTTIILPDKPTEADRFAAYLISNDLEKRFNLKINTLSATEYSGNIKNLIIIGEAETNSLLTKSLPNLQNLLKKIEKDQEGYILIVNSDIACIVGCKVKGTFYGVQTLRQMFDYVDDKVFLPNVNIFDYPALGIRGWHFFRPTEADKEIFKQWIDLLALLKFNTVIIEVNDGLKYERERTIKISHPQALSKTEFSELVSYAKKYHFEVIPQVQTFGHFDYVLNKPEFSHLAENPQPDFKGSRWLYCPSNEEVYPLVFDMFEEVIEVFKPKYFHIGHDEITFAPLGVNCPRCKNTPPHILLANEVTKLYNFLKDRDIKILMWDDQLLDPEFSNYHKNGGAPYFTAKAISLVPKDIIICAWNYAPVQIFPSIDYFQKNGFPIIASGWHNTENVYNFTKLAAEKKILGYIGTTWAGLANVPKLPDLMSAVVLTAENTWTPLSPKIEKMTYHPTNEFVKLYQLQKHHIEGKDFFIVDLSAYYNFEIEKLLHKPSKLPIDIQWANDAPFQIGKGCIMLTNDLTEKGKLPEAIYQIPVGSKAKYLFFLHTTTEPRETVNESSCHVMYERLKKDPGKIGSYIITYEDYSTETVDLIYRKNIVNWNDRVGTEEAPIVWQGKTKDGALIQLVLWSWKNPMPDKKIITFDFISLGSEVSPVLISLTGLR